MRKNRVLKKKKNVILFVSKRGAVCSSVGYQPSAKVNRKRYSGHHMSMKDEDEKSRKNN
jgi:hypothetical protein